MSIIVARIKKFPGFTLIEVITILFIISLSLVGVLSLIVQSLNSQTYNKNNLIAYQLAQEGVELIRCVRDSNWRAGQAWDTNLAVGPYYMDYLDAVPNVRTRGDQDILRIDDNGFYFHDENGLAPDSGFSRLMRITSLEGGAALTLIVEISWADHGHNYLYELETFLYDWR